MATGSSRPRAPRAGARPPLPKVTVGKFRRASELLERMARENTSRFAGAMGDYRAEHRERNSRPLNPAEAAQLAAALAESMPEVAEDPAAAAAQLQASDLRAYDEPQPQEVLFAAGAATAPAFLELATRFMCLVEMPSDVFKQACREDELDDRLDEAVAELDDVDVAEARERAGRALAHFSGKVGVSGPKAWELLGRTIVGSLLEAAKRTSPSTQSSLTSSAASTPASPETTSSSGSPSAT